MTRYLRIIKNRGSSHGTNEYPFSITHNGISLLPITSTKLNTTTSAEYLSTGIKALDSMLGSKGYQTGSQIIISGRSGTAKRFCNKFRPIRCSTRQESAVHLI